MIFELDESLRQILKKEMPIKNGEIEISFDIPKREWSSRLSKPTINFFLYDIRENKNLRQHQWENMAKKSGNNGLAQMKRTPYRIDCTYIITAWAADPGDEHRLISRCLMTLFKFPVLPHDLLTEELQKQPYEIQTFLAQTDKYKNPAEVWSALDNEMRLSVPYIVTVSLDPWEEITGPLVSTFTLKTGHAEDLPQRKPAFIPDTNVDEIVYIGGTVWEKKINGDPAADIQVAIKGTGYMARSNKEGRFVFHGVPTGKQTLIAWLPDNNIVETEITVPSKDGKYNIVIK